MYMHMCVIGYLPAIFIMESLMDDVARNIGMDVEQFKQANLYKKGDVSYLVSLNYSNNNDRVITLFIYTVISTERSDTTIL